MMHEVVAHSNYVLLRSPSLSLFTHCNKLWILIRCHILESTGDSGISTKESAWLRVGVQNES